MLVEPSKKHGGWETEAGRREFFRTGEDEIAEIVQTVRENDQKRFEAQILGGLQAGRELLLQTMPPVGHVQASAATSLRALLDQRLEEDDR